MLGNNVIAQTYNWLMQSGTDIVIPVYLLDSGGAAINLTGYTARMKVKSKNPYLELLDLSTSDTSPSSRIEITAATGLVNITIANADSTATVSSASAAGVAFYDLELIDSAGLVNRVMQGEITPSAEITD